MNDAPRVGRSPKLLRVDNRSEKTFNPFDVSRASTTSKRSQEDDDSNEADARDASDANKALPVPKQEEIDGSSSDGDASDNGTQFKLPFP